MIDLNAPYVVIFRDRRVMEQQYVTGASLIDMLPTINTKSVEFFQRLEGPISEYHDDHAAG